MLQLFFSWSNLFKKLVASLALMASLFGSSLSLQQVEVNAYSINNQLESEKQYPSTFKDITKIFDFNSTASTSSFCPQNKKLYTNSKYPDFKVCYDESWKVEEKMGEKVTKIRKTLELKFKKNDTTLNYNFYEIKFNEAWRDTCRKEGDFKPSFSVEVGNEMLRFQDKRLISNNFLYRSKIDIEKQITEEQVGSDNKKGYSREEAEKIFTSSCDSLIWNEIGNFQRTIGLFTENEGITNFFTIILSDTGNKEIIAQADEIVLNTCFDWKETCDKLKQKIDSEEKSQNSTSTATDEDDGDPDPYKCEDYENDPNKKPTDIDTLEVCFGDGEEGEMEKEIDLEEIKQELIRSEESNSREIFGQKVNVMQEVWKATDKQVIGCLIDSPPQAPPKDFWDSAWKNTTGGIDTIIEFIPGIGDLYQSGKAGSGWSLTGQLGCAERWISGTFAGVGLTVTGASCAGGAVAAGVGCFFTGSIGSAVVDIAKQGMKETIKQGGKQLVKNISKDGLKKLVQKTIRGTIENAVTSMVIDQALNVFLFRENKDALWAFDKNTVENQEVEVAYNFEPSEGVKLASLGSAFSKASKKAPQVVIKDSKAVMKVGGRKFNFSEFVKKRIEQIQNIAKAKTVVASYNALNDLTKGFRNCKTGACVDAHHLLEKRMVLNTKLFPKLEGELNTKIPCLLLDKEVHKKITKELAEKIPTDASKKAIYNTITKDQIKDIYKEVYKNNGLEDIFTKNILPLFD